MLDQHLLVLMFCFSSPYKELKMNSKKGYDIPLYRSERSRLVIFKC